MQRKYRVLFSHPYQPPTVIIVEASYKEEAIILAQAERIKKNLGTKVLTVEEVGNNIFSFTKGDYTYVKDGTTITVAYKKLEPKLVLNPEIFTLVEALEEMSLNK
jgi:hypothetical protein